MRARVRAEAAWSPSSAASWRAVAAAIVSLVASAAKKRSFVASSTPYFSTMKFSSAAAASALAPRSWKKRLPPAKSVIDALRPALCDHGSLGSVTTCPSSTRVPPPAG